MKSIIGTLVSLTMLSGLALGAQTHVTNDGWIPILELRTVGAYPSGGKSAGLTSWELKADGPHQARVSTGASLCQVGAGGGAGMPPPAPAMRTVWNLTTEHLGEQGGRHTVRATAQFARLDGEPGPATPITQTLSLREGDAVSLEVLRGQPTPDCPVRLLNLEVRLALQPIDGAAARVVYGADLWLTHTDANGQQSTRQLTLSLDSEHTSPFTFPAMRFPIPQFDPRQGNAEAFMLIGGTLRARTLPAGQVALDLGTMRRAGLWHPDQLDARLFGVNGVKSLVVSVDETTAIDLPPIGSSSSMLAFPGTRVNGSVGAGGAGTGPARAGGYGAGGAAAGPTNPANPISVAGNALAMRTDQFFQGHRTQLIVRLRKIGG